MLSIEKSWYEKVEKAIEYVTLMDAENRLLYVNHAQDGAETYVGRPVFDYVDPNYHDLLRESVETARQSRLPQHFVSSATGPNGEKSTYSNWVFPVLIENGKGIVAFVATDVTHQGRVEAALELSEITLQSLVHNSPDTILVVDRERKILFINRDDMGFGIDKIIGMPAESFVPETEKQKVIERIERVLRTGEETQYETEMEGPEGGIQRFSTRLNPICVDAKIDRVMLVATDITEKHRAAQEREQLASQLYQAQKMESLGQLTGGVAHDFNNLLTAISANCEVAKQVPGIPTQAKQFINQTLEAVGLAKSLTQRLLAFSRKQTLRPEVVDVGKLVLEVHQLLQRTLGETIQVKVSAEKEIWSCKVDPGQLENSILNLALNARDAMPQGGYLAIQCSNVSIDRDNDGVQEPGDYVRFTVEDSGTGMSPEIAAQAIEPFFTTKDVGEGSGLGLSMVYGFVRQSNGHLRILSQPEAGTRIEIDLPRARSATKVQEQVSVSGNMEKGDGELVLIVEDDELVRTSVEMILKRLGYRTQAAETALEALELLENQHEIALVLSDVVLRGGMSGFELASKARQFLPELRFIFVSGYPEAGLKMSTSPIESRILEKPYTMEQLAQAIYQALTKTGASCN